jgi:hypothetical protein
MSRSLKFIAALAAASPFWRRSMVGWSASSARLESCRKRGGIASSIDCRSEDELLIGALANGRVQKIACTPGRSSSAGS